MKNVIKSFLTLAASLLAFNACQEVETPVNTAETHTVRFVAGTPETKTSFEVNGNVVTYKWSDTDQTDHSTGSTKRPEKFQVFENGVAATSIDAQLIDGSMVIDAEFANTTAESFEYQALFNSGVKAEQSSSDESYDQFSDVLISNVLTDNDNLVFSFKREVAMAIVTLKGLEKGDYLYNVKIDSDKSLAGTYNKDSKNWENTSTSLSIDSFNEITDGVAKLYFITTPVEGAMLKVTVQTTDDLDNVTATYVKEFSKAISFSRGDVRAFSVDLEGCETLPEVEHTISWTDYADWDGCTLSNGSVQGSETISLKTMPFGYSVVLKKDSSSNSNPTINTTYNDCRLYANGTATISNGKDITKIVFNISAAGKKRLAPITASVGTIATQASGDDKVIWTGRAKEVTFTVGENSDFGSDGSTKAGQLDFSSIDVTYIDDGTPEPEPEKPTEYNISIDDKIIGGVVSADKKTAVAGSQISLSYEAAEGYEFGSWNVTNTSGETISVTNSKFTMPAADVNVSASFKEVSIFEGTITTMSAAKDADIKFVTGSSSVTGAVWANSNPHSANNIALSGSVTSGTNFSYYDGTVVRFYTNNNIVITPSNGATIEKIEIVRQSTTSNNSGTINCSGLTASSGNTTTNTNEFTGTATSAVTFTASAQARFTEIKVYSTGGVPPTIYTITIADGIDNGTVTASASAAEEGTIVTLSATPAEGYEFDSWNVTGATVANATNSTTTFTMPASNVTVSASFKEEQNPGGGEEDGDEVTGTIKFGTNDVKINAASVTGDDDLGNTWTITTVGTTSFTANSAYYQVGSSSKPATSVTFTTTLPNSVKVTSMSAKFGGFSGTKGTVELKVGETSIGEGSLNATSDVTVESESSASGTVLTVTVTGIDKGVKVYNISYTYPKVTDQYSNE